MDLENYHQWMLKPLGERVMGHFLMKGPDWSLKIIKRGIDQFNIIISRTLEEISVGVGYCGDGFHRCIHRSKFIILCILIMCTLLYANYTSKSYFLKSGLKHYVSHDAVGSTQHTNKLILPEKLNLKMIKPVEPTTSLWKIWVIEECITWHHV